MDKARLTFLFHRYVENTCTEEEKAEFLRYVRDPHNEVLVKALMGILWKEITPQQITVDRSEEILATILGKHKSAFPVAERAGFPWLSVAASLLLMAVFAAGFIYYSGLEQSGPSAETSVKSPIPDSRFVKLADGSSVVLNKGSKLEYPDVFDDSVREVSLVGEGYFEIAHDAKRPFIVYTGKVRTTVLGTAFNIRAYPDQSDITVTVTRGKVKVSNNEKVLGIINPDQQITINTAQASAEQQAIDSHAVTAWMERDVFFDDVTIGQALEQLEKRFNIKVALENGDISGCRFTATFVQGEDIGQILRILCDFNNAKLVIKEPGSYAIEGGKCPVRE